MGIKQKLAILASRFPYPLTKGDKLRLFYQIQSLAEHFDICLFALSDEVVTDEHRNALLPYCSTIKIYSLKKWRCLVNAAVFAVSGKPAQLGYFHSTRIKKQLQADIAACGANKLYCQLIRMSPYAIDFDGYKVLDYQDAFSLNYFRTQQRSFGLMKLFYKLESKHMLRYERLMFEKFQQTFIINKIDKAFIEREITVLPNGVDVQQFIPSRIEKEYDVAFVGNMNYLPNKQALIYILNELVPLLKRHRANIKIVIAGSVIPSQFLQNRPDSITYLENVKDISLVYKKSKVFVAPLFIGAGMQNKILEALACGIPCITTQIVANSFEQYDEVLLIAENTKQFVQLILQELQEPRVHSNVLRTYIEKHYQWRSVNARLLSALS